jgi:hypothetical protein
MSNDVRINARGGGTSTAVRWALAIAILLGIALAISLVNRGKRPDSPTPVVSATDSARIAQATQRRIQDSLAREQAFGAEYDLERAIAAGDTVVIRQRLEVLERAAASRMDRRILQEIAEIRAMLQDTVPREDIRARVHQLHAQRQHESVSAALPVVQASDTTRQRRATTTARTPAARVSVQRDGCLRNRSVPWPDGLRLTPYAANVANAIPKATIWAECDRTYDAWENIRIVRLKYLLDESIECPMGGCLPVVAVAWCTWNESEAWAGRPREERAGFAFCDNYEDVRQKTAGVFVPKGGGIWELPASRFPVACRDCDVYIYRGDGTTAIGQHTKAFENTQYAIGYLPDREPVVAAIPFMVYDGVPGTQGNLENHDARSRQVLTAYRAIAEDVMGRFCLMVDSRRGLMMPCVDEAIWCVLAHARVEHAFSITPLRRGQVCFDPPGLQWYFRDWLRPKIQPLNQHMRASGGT